MVVWCKLSHYCCQIGWRVTQTVFCYPFYAFQFRLESLILICTFTTNKLLRFRGLGWVWHWAIVQICQPGMLCWRGRHSQCMGCSSQIQNSWDDQSQGTEHRAGACSLFAKDTYTDCCVQAKPAPANREKHSTSNALSTRWLVNDKCGISNIRSEKINILIYNHYSFTSSSLFPVDLFKCVGKLRSFFLKYFYSTCISRF